MDLNHPARSKGSQIGEENFTRDSSAKQLSQAGSKNMKENKLDDESGEEE
jgi:hypothetical protein